MHATQRQCDFATAVTKTAMFFEGLTKEAFLQLIGTAWDVLESSDNEARVRCGELCEDCPPVGYPTESTRCRPCPRRASTSTSTQTEKS
jgi:hypothetical protein